MDTGVHNPHDRTHERAALMQAEQSRRQQSGRDFYWDAQRWVKRLAALINREQESDAIYQQQIDELVVGSETQIILEQRIDTSLTDDIAWYQLLLRTLRELRIHWETLGRTESTHYADLVSHECQAESRLIQRQIRLQQLWLENLERRRRLHGALEPDKWAQYWNELHSVFNEQAQFTTRAYGIELPAYYLEQRLGWLTHLREFQHTTKQIWHDNEYFDKVGYRADTRQIDRAIAQLTPVEAGSSRDGGGILGVVLIIGVIVVLFGVLTGGPKSTIQTTETGQVTAADLNNEGLALIKEGRCPEAMAKFEQAAAADPLFYEPLNNIAFCLYDQGQIDQAIIRWRKALELNPASADTNAGLGMALYTQGDLDEGKRYYQEAIRIEPNYNDPSWLKSERLWSDRAIADSSALREPTAP